MRRDYELVRANGINVHSPDGDFSVTPDALEGRLFHQDSLQFPNEVFFDWVLICLKSTSLFEDDGANIRNLLDPLVSSDTRILVIMNGLCVEEKFASWYGRNRVFGGMAFIGVNRISPTESNQPLLINHVAFGSISIGHLDDDPSELQLALNLWKHTVLEMKVTIVNSLQYGRWSKLAWNIPFTGLSVALGGVTTDMITTDVDLRQLADKIMTETLQIANLDLLITNKNNIIESNDESDLYCYHHNSKDEIKLFDIESIKAHCWAIADNIGPYKTSAMLDLLAGQEMEIEYIFNRPLQRAKDILAKHPIPEYPTSLFPWPYFDGLVMQLNGIQRLAKRRSS